MIAYFCLEKNRFGINQILCPFNEVKFYHLKDIKRKKISRVYSKQISKDLKIKNQ